MRARVYLNGDGMGKGTHVSLFFVLCRGAYDPLLPWPFRPKVHFYLQDQSGSDDHIVESFRPDPNSSSFRRPTSDMNVASGCPMFLPVRQLEANLDKYVRDDTMFIKITVDTSELPTFKPEY